MLVTYLVILGGANKHPGPLMVMEQQRLLPSQLGLTNTEKCDLVSIEESIQGDDLQSDRKRRRKWIRLVFGICIGTAGLVLGFICGRLFAPSKATGLPRYTEIGTSGDNACASPPVRREWRSLSTIEKDRYIDAVLCLTTRPSRLGMSHSLYDDFAYVHYHFDEDSE